MSFDFNRLLKARPYLYHLTAEQNLNSILLHGELRCANSLLHAGRLEHLTSQRRLDHLSVQLPAGPVSIRDQRPLVPGAIAFEDGWSLERFVAHVNEHVFFWPGTSDGPVKAGRNHFERYRDERPVIIRLPTAALSLQALLYCRYNSGAPRCSGGKYSPRGSATYLPAEKFSGGLSEVVEVVALRACVLPPTAQLAHSLEGPWSAINRVA